MLVVYSSFLSAFYKSSDTIRHLISHQITILNFSFVRDKNSMCVFGETNRVKITNKIRSTTTIFLIGSENGRKDVNISIN